MKVKSILVPTDFSGAAEHAADWAAKLAEYFEAEVVLLHVIDISFLLVPSIPTSGPIMMPDHGVLDDLNQHASRELKRLADRFLTCRTELQQGTPKLTIIEVAEEVRPDLIVMGTHGRTGLSYMLMGSVAEYVLRHTKVPVLAVPLVSADQQTGARRDIEAELAGTRPTS